LQEALRIPRDARYVPEHGDCKEEKKTKVTGYRDGHILGEYGQAKKGSWWMPRSYCPKKAVVSCEKPGGGAHIPRSPDSRMG
jgi:hypothetical protein